MNKILFCWEMGDNFGHLARDLPVAKQLRKQGYDVVFAVKDTRIARAILGPENFKFIQGPRLNGGSTNVPPATYAEILLSQGYFDQSVLRALVQAWMNVFKETSPAVLVANHAPTAVLAARCSSLPILVTGIGFELPPVTPTPISFRPHETVPLGRLTNSERLALDNINQILGFRGLSAIGHTSELFSEVNVIMTTFSELDHYGPREHFQYVGLTSELRSQPFNWQHTSGTRIFCYLRNNCYCLDTVLAALGESEHEALCVIPDARDEILEKYSGSRVCVQREPVNVKTAMLNADLVITYGTGTMHDALMMGCPILICPQNAEQFMAGVRVVTLGAGLMLPNGVSLGTTKNIIQLLVNDVKYASAASKFSEKYARVAIMDAATIIVRKLESLL